MRSSVRLIIPDVPARDALGQAALVTRSRLECHATRAAIEGRMRTLAARTRELPLGYPHLGIQRRTDRDSRALRWFSSSYRMLSDARFEAAIARHPAAIRTWLLESQLQARWLNSQERVCRLLAEEYSALAELLAKSSSPAVPTTISDSGGLHHGKSHRT